MHYKRAAVALVAVGGLMLLGHQEEAPEPAPSPDPSPAVRCYSRLATPIIPFTDPLLVETCYPVYQDAVTPSSQMLHKVVGKSYPQGWYFSIPSVSI